MNNLDLNPISNTILTLPPTTAESSEPVSEPFSYDGYQVVRGEFFAHLFEPSVTLNNEKVAVNSVRKIQKIPFHGHPQILKERNAPNPFLAKYSLPR